MPKVKITKNTLKLIDKLENKYKEKIRLFIHLSEVLYKLFSNHEFLKPYVHSVKYRPKDPDHLKRKLIRKAIEKKANNEIFDINIDNLFQKIDDLSGIRILHLHTEQIKDIDIAVRKILNEENYSLIEGPIANTWDVEYENYYKSLSMKINQRDSLYTSVHYIIQTGNQLKAEIQIRTLLEEVWGEVSHKINYPEKTKSIACEEQIKVLARITSSGTRLVDSIFKSENEYNKISNKSS